MGDSGSYRWIVLGVSTAVNALGWAARSTFALFYVAILQEFAWGRGATALGYSLSWLCFVVFAPLAGWLHDHWGAPTVVTTGGVALGVALALTGQVTSLTQYYLCFGILSAAGITTVLTGVRMPRMNAITERWIGGCRRELLDRTLVWNQTHLRQILRQYETHHNQHRPHRSLHGAAPLKPLPEPVVLDLYRIRKQAHVGGMINEYRLVA